MDLTREWVSMEDRHAIGTEAVQLSLIRTSNYKFVIFLNQDRASLIDSKFRTFISSAPSSISLIESRVNLLLGITTAR